MTALLDTSPMTTAVPAPVPTTWMTSVAVLGSDAPAMAHLLHQLADRVAELGAVEIHDVVVTPTSHPGDSSTATVYFVA